MSSLGVGKFCTLVNLFRCLVPRSFVQTWAPEPQWKQVVCPVFGSPWSTVVGGKGFGVWMPLIYVSKWDTNIWLLFTGSRRSETSKISHNLQSGHIWGETRHFGPLCKLWLILEVSDLWDPVNKSQTLYIEAKLGGTVISQVVGYYMGEKMIPRVGGGQSHLQLEILGLLSPRLGFRMELKPLWEKGYIHSWWGGERWGIPEELGFGSHMVFILGAGVYLISSRRYSVLSYLIIGSELSSRERRIWHIFGYARCMGFLERWVLVSIWVWPHYCMNRNGILTFGFSSSRTGDLGTHLGGGRE